MAQFFNKNLKYIRKIKNISQQELADKLNIDRSSISRWENEDMEATVDKALQVAKVLDVPLPEFLATDLTTLGLEGLLELANGMSYNEVLNNEKMRDDMSDANRHYIKCSNGEFIDEDNLDFPINKVIKNKEELSKEEEMNLLKNTLKRKGFLNDNEEMTEEDFNKLIEFAKANKQFIMKDKDKQ